MAFDAPVDSLKEAKFGLQVCGVGAQPEDFEIPDWYEPDEDEKRKLEEEQMNERLTMQRIKLDEFNELMREKEKMGKENNK